VEEFLYANVCNRISMDDLSRVCGENPRNVANAFRRLRGCTPAACQRRARLAIAQTKLSETNAAIATIAAETGFFDQAHFSHQFKAMVGHSPLRYRQLLRRPRSTRITKSA
jgi:AraC family transcriptional regulator